MFALNTRALTLRYSRHTARKDASGGFTYESGNHFYVREIQAYKYLENWLSQCNQGNLDETRFYKLMQRVFNAMAHSIARKHDLYESSYWG
jgi:hypothetical protein